MRTGHAKRRSFLVHQFRKGAFAAGNMLRNGLCCIVAGNEHHAVKQGTQGKLLPANNAHCGAAGFHGIADRDHHIEIRAGFNGENAGHDFGCACRKRTVTAALFIQNRTGRSFHQHDMGGGDIVRMKRVSQRRGGQQRKRGEKRQQAGNGFFQVNKSFPGR